MLKRAFVITFAVVLNIAGSVFADEVIDGRVSGSLYRLVRPTNWNGRLVLYAHGFVPSDAPVALPPEGSLLISLLAPQGFAVAYSSFSENGWAVRDGMERTHQLLGIFSARFARPERVYVTGVSMGGLIAIKLSETYPNFYAGALPAGAVAGGPRRQFDYEANIWTLFDFLYPGVLPGDAANVPEGIDVTQTVVLPALAAMEVDPSGAIAMAQIDQIPIPFATPDELVESILTALAYYATEFTDLTSRTHGHGFFDNSNMQYTGALPPEQLQAINAGIQRFTASADALNYLEHFYNPSGALRIPMLTLATSRDPVVPGFHQISYRDGVASAGASYFLVQREIERYGHLTFTPRGVGAGFQRSRALGRVRREAGTIAQIAVTTSRTGSPNKTAAALEKRAEGPINAIVVFLSPCLAESGTSATP
jgi:pimeloyl-ACP methyl ester carboxylesterase